MRNQIHPYLVVAYVGAARRGILPAHRNINRQSLSLSIYGKFFALFAGFYRIFLAALLCADEYFRIILHIGFNGGNYYKFILFDIRELLQLHIIAAIALGVGRQILIKPSYDTAAVIILYKRKLRFVFFFVDHVHLKAVQLHIVIAAV